MHLYLDIHNYIFEITQIRAINGPRFYQQYFYILHAKLLILLSQFWSYFAKYHSECKEAMKWQYYEYAAPEYSK